MANHVDYFEIGTPNAAEGRAFYGDLFGWTFGEAGPTGYAAGVENPSGLWGTETIGGGNWAIFYVHVDDVAASVEKAASLGATVLMPVVDTGTIHFAHLADLDGNRFGVWRPHD